MLIPGLKQLHWQIETKKDRITGGLHIFYITVFETIKKKSFFVGLIIVILLFVLAITISFCLSFGETRDCCMYF